MYINVGYALGSTFAMVNGEAEAARLMMGCRRNGKMTLFVLCNLIGETQLLSQTGIEFLDQFAKVSTSLWGLQEAFHLAVEDLEAIEHPNIPPEGARVSHFVESLNVSYSKWKRDLMKEIRQRRVEPPPLCDSSLPIGIQSHPYRWINHSW